MNIKFGILFSMLFITIGGVVNATDTENSILRFKSLLTEQDSTGNPPIFFKDGKGEVVSVNDLKGKVVFINFWAPWCPPCIEEMPGLNSLKNKFNGNEKIVFLMVDVDNNREKAQAFMDEHDLQLPVYTPHGEIPSLYLSRGIPTTIILDKKGEIVSRIEGGRDYTQPRFEKALKELINED
ncbi:TlpA family protein disulfide reductase [Sphingobacterium haloxyli]|uniref:Thioredoxin n=1 Tax=Sphingobacterium haloxyli TaxID=2100533 RepID=A0A2S9J4T6_9SPHI|nr:TlpA disulfide reductase family protein [Sphingobacterium haloxyli]PRD47770.1 thioredoxin [Sphingobacterium haloxyli]